MTYKEFFAWCNDRAADGCWGIETAIYCIDIINQIRKEPFWKREKKWKELNEKYTIVEDIINPINNKINEIINGGI